MDPALIHLDTGFVIRALQEGSHEDAEFNGWVARGVRLGISSVAWGEFLCGPLEPSHPDLIMKVVGEPEPFLGSDARAAAEFFNLSGRRRGIFLDCMIAAIAVRVGAALATTNPTDFIKCEGLVLASKR